MGRDIHLHVEYKRGYNNDEWHHSSFYGEFKSREYALFDKIISDCGCSFPKDASDYTKIWYEKLGEDAHDTGYMSPNELECCLNDIERKYEVDVEWYALLAYMRKLEEECKDVRAVFWFDN